MALDYTYRTPRWLRDLQRFLPLKSQFVLTGNVRDLQLIEASPGQVVPVPLATALATQFIANGYRHAVAYEPTNGFRMAPSLSAPSGNDEVLSHLGLTPGGGRRARRSRPAYRHARAGRLLSGGANRSSGGLRLAPDRAERVSLTS
jgi:hypothetical protein